MNIKTNIDIIDDNNNININNIDAINNNKINKIININKVSEDAKRSSIEYKKLINLLNKLRHNKEDPNSKMTHTSLGIPKGSYCISNDNTTKFYDLYKKVISENIDMYLTEVHNDQGPLILDIDIKYHLKTGEEKRIYTYENILELIKIYNKLLIKYLDVSFDDLYCYIMEKDHPTIKKILDTKVDLKDGFHIMYPNLCLSNKLQYVLRDECIGELKINNIWNNLIVDNDIEDIIDHNIISSTNWMLYGSCKPGYENNKYKLTRVLDDEFNEVKLNDIDIYELPSKLSIRKYNHSSDKTIYRAEYTDEKIEELYSNMQYTNKKTSTIVCSSKENSIENIIRAKKLIKLLNPERAISYNTWIEVGFCLHNIDDSLLCDWIEFSMQSDKFKTGECERLWFGFKNYGYTIKSLRYWARKDSPDKFSQFIIDNAPDIFKISMSGTSYDVAKAFYEFYNDDYVCCSIKHKMWYEFKHHKWVPVDCAYTIYNKLNEDMVDQYLKLAQAFGNKAINSNGDEKDRYLERQQAAIKLCTRLRTTSFKKQIMDELIILFYDPTFLSELDEARDLLCFNNGVFDLKNNEFREGRPDDKISLCTNVNYLPYNSKHNIIKKVENFFYQIQPDPSMHNYILDFMASCLQGNIPDEKFHIWTGSGCHPAGTMIETIDNIKPVEKIKVGDVIKDELLIPQCVEKLYRGFGLIFKVSNIINDIEVNNYRVNGDHRLAVYLEESFTLHWISENKLKLSWIEPDNNKIEIKSKVFNMKNNIILDEYNLAYKWYLKNCSSSYSYKHKIISIPVWQYIMLSWKWKLNLKGIIESKNECLHTDIKIRFDTIARYYGFQLSGSQKYFVATTNYRSLTYNSNGKSLSINLLSQALGDYASTLSVSLITNKRPLSNSATPDLAKTKGKRFCFIQEPEQNDTIYVGRMKELTSNNDKLQARELYKEPIEFFPQFKLLLACNDLPAIPANDGGTWRRLRVVPFEMKFVDNPQATNEKKIDRNIKEELPYWREGLLSILIHRYQNYKVNGLIEPEKVTKFTLEYQMDSDVYLEFMTDNLIETKNKKDVLDLQEVYDVYKFWYTQLYSNKTVAQAREFKKQLLLKLKINGKPKYIYGFKFYEKNNNENTLG